MTFLFFRHKKSA